MRRVIAVVALAGFLSGCVGKEEAQSDMAGFPMHNVQIGLPVPFVCDWNERTGVHYTGVDDETGKSVSGTLCTNLFGTTATIHPSKD